MLIRYSKPADNEQGFAEVTVSREEAIRIQKEYVAKSHPHFTYQSDEEALLDYITVHWAWIVDESAS